MAGNLDESFNQFETGSIGCISRDPLGFDYGEALQIETDPTGRLAGESGSKLDAGKVRPELIFRGFANALLAIAEVGTFGANKYCDDGWMEVPNGRQRYTDALFRHYLKEMIGEEVDSDSNLAHSAHLAWNALARLELQLREAELKVK